MDSVSGSFNAAKLSATVLSAVLSRSFSFVALFPVHEMMSRNAIVSNGKNLIGWAFL
jgi:hypothetical protein